MHESFGEVRLCDVDRARIDALANEVRQLRQSLPLPTSTSVFIRLEDLEASPPAGDPLSQSGSVGA